jgi:hypothetical protein
VSLPQIIEYFLHLKSGIIDEPYHVIGMIHLAVPVGDGSEIKTDLREAECGGLIFLTVPKGFHDIQSAVGIHNHSRSLQYAQYLVFAEAIQELTHPDGIIMLVGRKSGCAVEQIGAESVYSLSPFFVTGLFCVVMSVLIFVK